MEGLKISKANLTVYIHPSMNNNVRGAILTQLSSLLFTYNEDIEGVLLAYEVQARSKVAKILPEGKVVKLGRESIHAIVLGFSSAAIMRGDICEDMKYMIKHGKETYTSVSHKRHRIKVGSFIRFAVKSMDEEILHISGSLVPPLTGCIHWLSKYGMESDLKTERSSKRHLEKEENPISTPSVERRRLHKAQRTSE